MNWVLGKVAGSGGFDLEAVEGTLRAAVLAAGGRLLGELLEVVGSGQREAPVLIERRRQLPLHDRARLGFAVSSRVVAHGAALVFKQLQLLPRDFPPLHVLPVRQD